MSEVKRAATAREVTEIVGRLDDDVMMEILGTGASPVEVLEAFTWLTADDQIGTEIERGRRGATAAVYEILSRVEPDPDER